MSHTPPWVPQPDAVLGSGTSCQTYEPMLHSYEPSTGYQPDVSSSAAALQAFVPSTTTLPHPQNDLPAAAARPSPFSAPSQQAHKDVITDYLPMRASQEAAELSGHGPAHLGYLSLVSLNASWNPTPPSYPTTQTHGTHFQASEQSQLCAAGWSYWGADLQHQPLRPECISQYAAASVAPQYSSECRASQLHPWTLPQLLPPLRYPGGSSYHGNASQVSPTARLPPLYSHGGLARQIPTFERGGTIQQLVAAERALQSAHQQAAAQQHAEQLLHAAWQQQDTLEQKLLHQVALQKGHLMHPAKVNCLPALHAATNLSSRRHAEMGVPQVQKEVVSQALQSIYTESMLKLLGTAAPPPPVAAPTAPCMAQKTQFAQQAQHSIATQAQSSLYQESMGAIMQAPRSRTGPSMLEVQSGAGLDSIQAAAAAAHLATLIRTYWDGPQQLVQAEQLCRAAAIPGSFPIAVPQPTRLSDSTGATGKISAPCAGEVMEVRVQAPPISHAPCLPQKVARRRPVVIPTGAILKVATRVCDSLDINVASLPAIVAGDIVQPSVIKVNS